MLKYILAFWFTATAALAQPVVDMSQLPLVNATEISSERHIILTLPLTQDSLDTARAEALAADFGLELAAIWPLRSVNVTCYVLVSPAGADLSRISASLAAEPNVLSAAPVVDFQTLTDYPDELLPIQHGFHEVKALQAHAFTTGSDVQVAVIDSGVAVSHPDLAAQNIVYRDFIVPGAERATGEGHGTAVAALIAADARNGAGMVGIAPDAALLALRACWAAEDGPDRCNSFSIARALNFAILNEADVINLSLGGTYDPLIEQLIDAALQSGVLVVAARGDDESVAFPGNIDGVVSAVAHERAATGGLLAPGLEVLSAKPGGDYDFFTGDSVAAAHVSGVAALLLSASSMGPAKVAAILHDANTAEGGKGVLDACLALIALRDDVRISCD